MDSSPSTFSPNETLWLLVDAALWVDGPESYDMDIDEETVDVDIEKSGEMTSSSNSVDALAIFKKALAAGRVKTKSKTIKAESLGDVTKSILMAPNTLRCPLCTKPSMIGKVRDAMQLAEHLRCKHAAIMAKERIRFGCSSCNFRRTGAYAATGHLTKCKRKGRIALFRTIKGKEKKFV